MRVKTLLVAVTIPTLAALPAGAAPGCATPGETVSVRLAGVDAAGDPVLADGRNLRLVGLAPRQDAAETQRFRAALEPFRDRPLELAIAGERDRWGRWPARLYLPADAPGGRPGELTVLLQQSGAAMPLAEPAALGCVETSVPAGQAATSTHLASASIAVDGHDLAAVKAQEGRYVRLEGRIASVGERSQRTYLNFSRRPGEAASIVVSRSLWRELKGAGWTAAGLGGKRLRAYGVLAGRGGLLLEATSRAALELID